MRASLESAIIRCLAPCSLGRLFRIPGKPLGPSVAHPVTLGLLFANENHSQYGRI